MGLQDSFSPSDCIGASMWENSDRTVWARLYDFGSIALRYQQVLNMLMSIFWHVLKSNLAAP